MAFCLPDESVIALIDELKRRGLLGASAEVRALTLRAAVDEATTLTLEVYPDGWPDGVIAVARTADVVIKEVPSA